MWTCSLCEMQFDDDVNYHIPDEDPTIRLCDNCLKDWNITPPFTARVNGEITTIINPDNKKDK